jgi:predicted tellurium resistance membrane protein TerC
VDLLTNPETWVALLTLTSLEIVLGIDNVVFISILAAKLTLEERARARTVGLSLAMFMRIALLFSLSWVIGLTEPLFDVLDKDFSGRDLILLGGGLFLVAKATLEIHEKLEGDSPHEARNVATAGFASIIIQILLLDIVFSLDSVITAAGMAEELAVMIAAVVIAVGVMLVASGPISRFVEEHPTIKMLALSFLLLIGLGLVLDGVGRHIPKGYIYFAMGFSLFVELLNLRIHRRKQPVVLHRRYEDGAGPPAPSGKPLPAESQPGS